MASAAPVVFRKLRREKAMICEWRASDDRSRKVYAIAALLSHRFLLHLSRFCAKCGDSQSGSSVTLPSEIRFSPTNRVAFLASWLWQWQRGHRLVAAAFPSLLPPPKPETQRQPDGRERHRDDGDTCQAQPQHH